MTNKPNLDKLPNVTKIGLQTYERYLPSAFDESLSILQKINKVIQQLNTLGQVTNNIVGQWNDLLEWIIGQGLTDTVESIIDRKIEDGSFDVLFNSIVGILEELETVNKNTVVESINEVNEMAVKSKADIGNITELTTENKTDIVSAINEMVRDILINRQAPTTIGEATGYGTISGFGVRQQAVPSMAVEVGISGTENIVHMPSGVRYVMNQTTVPIDDSHPSLNRIDLVYVDVEGQVKVVKGSQLATAVKPTIPSGTVPLAYVTVLANDTSVNNSDITDARPFKNLDTLPTNKKENFAVAINELFETIHEVVIPNIGDVDNLETSNKENVVVAINEIVQNVGDKSALNSNDKSTVVNAINEIIKNNGSLSLLSTLDKSTLVNAINEIVQNVGNKSNLNTFEKTSIVLAINEVLNSLQTTVGSLNNLQTSDKTNLVNAINEILTSLDDVIQTNLSAIQENINEIEVNIGTMNALKTADKSTLVNAINEVLENLDEVIQMNLTDLINELGDVSTLTTVDKSSVVNAINELNLVQKNFAINTQTKLNTKVAKNELVYNVKDFGAKGDRVTDDTQAFKDAITAIPEGATLYIPVGFYNITDELFIEKSIKMMGDSANDAGSTYLNFDLSLQPTKKAGIRVKNGINGCKFIGFYMNNKTASPHMGIFLDGTGLNYGEAIWYTSFEDVYIRGFTDNFRVTNICIASFVNCRSIGATGNGFSQTSFATGLTFYSCYAQDCQGDGFKMNTAFYSGCFSCYSDGNARGYFYENCYGVFVRDCGSESCRMFAIAGKNSQMNVDGISVVESGMNQASVYQPTVLYVESGTCNVTNVSEERLHPTNTRRYTILYEAGARGNIITTGYELLDIYIPYDGSCSIDGQFYTEGVPTKTGWKQKDIGKIVYKKTVSEEGTTPNKYIHYGYRRMTSGNGNVLGTDWLPMRALTGN